MLEVAPPFRLMPKTERAGSMVRLIWLWFSVARFKGLDVNTLFRHIREDEITKYSQELTQIYTAIDQEDLPKAEHLISALENRMGEGTPHPELTRARALIRFLDSDMSEKEKI